MMDWECEHQGRVLYVDGEMTGSSLQQRLRMLGPFPDNMFILSREQFFLRKKELPDLGTEEGREALDRIMDIQKPDLVVLDSLSTLIRSGVENEAESWSPMQEFLLQQRWKGRTFLIVHHQGRSGKQRGTSKREDVTNVEIGLKKVEPKVGEVPKKNEGTFELAFTKHRDMDDSEAAPMVLHFSTASGLVEWTSESAAQSTRDRVMGMLDAGWKQADIAKELGISPGRVTQIKHEMRRAA